MAGRLKLGEMMLKVGLIDALQLNAALAHQRQWGGKLGSVLVELGFVDEDLLWKGLARQLGLPRADIANMNINPAIIARIPVELCEKHLIFPCSYRDDTKMITVATTEPNNTAAFDEITFMTRLRTTVALAPEMEIKWAIRRHYRGDKSPCPELRKKKQVAVDSETQDTEDMKVTDMSGNTVRKRISDILPPPGRQSAPPPPPPPPAPAFVPPPSPGPFGAPGTGFGAPQSVVAMPVNAVLSPEALAVKAELEKGNKFLKSIIELCISRGVFTQQEYMERLRRPA